MPPPPLPTDLQSVERAALTLGVSNDACYAAIDRALGEAGFAGGDLLLDLGCGQGSLWGFLQPRFQRCIGIDLVRHEGFPGDREFLQHDLQQPGIPLPDGCAAAVIACEVSPCVENPRLLAREMARLVKPGGWVAISNPNLETFFSLLMLVLKRRHRAFQDATAGFMITPLLEADLNRAFAAAGLTNRRSFYTLRGKTPFANGTWPSWLARTFPRRLSDNFGVLAQKPKA